LSDIVHSISRDASRVSTFGDTSKLTSNYMSQSRRFSR